jgi:hypothetical protein
MPPLVERIPFNAVQKAIYSRLLDVTDGVDVKLAANGSTTLIEGRVYDDPPELDEGSGVEYPYIEFGHFIGDEDGNKSRNVKRLTAVIDVYSTSTGQKEVNDILDAVLESLTTSPRSIPLDSPFSLAQSRYDGAETFKDLDGRPGAQVLVRHGVMRIALVVNQTS